MSDLQRFSTRGATATGGDRRAEDRAGQGQNGNTQPRQQPQPAQGARQDQGRPPGTAAATRPRPTAQTARSRAPRRAHLLVSRVDPWSVMKFSFVVSLVLFVVFFVAVAVLYSVLSGMGVFDSLISVVRDLSGGSDKWDISGWLSAKTILGWTAVLGAVNVVLLTALATLGGFIYNLVTSLVGGVEVTLSEAE